MTRYEFKPDLKKSGRNQISGTWEESACKMIELPLTKKSLKIVLSWGANLESSSFTHQEIANWCDQLHMESMNDNIQVDDLTVDIAADVDAQWDLYLVNTYNLQELQKLNFSCVKLPSEWFKEWLEKLGT